MTRRPAGVEWDDDVLATAEHGAPLLSRGRLLAGYRDASFLACPDTATAKRWHVVVVSHTVAIGGGAMGEAAACDPTRIMLGGFTPMPAHEVASYSRCRRRACAVLFARADGEVTA